MRKCLFLGYVGIIISCAANNGNNPGAGSPQTNESRAPSGDAGSDDARSAEGLASTDAGVPDAASTSSSIDEKKTVAALANKGKISYGAALSLLRLSFSRMPDEPARVRNYAPKLERISPEIGFQFSYSPLGAPWRVRTRNGVRDGYFQLMSYGGALLVRLSDQDFRQGGVSLAGNLSFFDESVSLGLGIDIYRAIPVLGPDGEAGGAFAYTGLSSWAFAREGELTPENVFLVFSINLAKIGGER